MRDNNSLKKMIGKHIGYLTIIGETAPRYNGNHIKRRVLCQCDCEEFFVSDFQHVKSGAVSSCGCYRKKLMRAKHKKENIYDLSNDYGIGYDKNGNKFFFDKEDYDKISKYYWYKNGNGYMISAKGILMHRLIMNLVDDDRIVDHISHQILDNRKINLRIVSCSQNQMNRTAKRSDVGVFFKHNKWYAKIAGKHLGTYDNKEDAIAARKAAEQKYYGEYSYDVSMKIAERNKIKEE